MENQHRLIKGYRELTPTEIDMMNRIKQLGEQLSGMVDEVVANNKELMSVISTEDDERARANLANEGNRWAAIAKTDLQKGIMALVRAVAKPTSF